MELGKGRNGMEQSGFVEKRSKFSSKPTEGV